MKTTLVYVPMAADILHHGHINIIERARSLGPVVVGLLSDEAIRSYKRSPVVSWEDRMKVVSAIKGVDIVVPQLTHDYVPNLETLHPAYVVHGSDWRTGVQSAARERVIEHIAQWGGQLIEPEYTRGISTTDIIESCKSR